MHLVLFCTNAHQENCFFYVISGFCWFSPVWFCPCSPPSKNMRRALKMPSISWYIISQILMNTCTLITVSHGHHGNSMSICVSVGNCNHRGFRSGIYREDLVCRMLLSIQRMEGKTQIRPETFLCYR